MIRRSRQNPVTVPKPESAVRRFATILAAALVLGLAAHAAFQAIEHHAEKGDAAALCAAAVSVIAVTCFVRRGGQQVRSAGRIRFALSPITQIAAETRDRRSSAAWLQRFRN